jgi:hypothetical protein
MAPELTEIALPAAPGSNRSGINFVRISAAAHAAWRKKIAEVRSNKASKLETARRQAQAVPAAKLSVTSPNHVSHHPRPAQRRRPRR